MVSPADDWKEAAFAAFVANQARQNALEQRRRFQRGEFTLELIASDDDPPPRDAAFQQELTAFSAELHAAGVGHSQRALSLDSAEAHGYPIPEFILALQVLAPPAMGVIGVAAGAWIQARYGRKVRLKVGDVEAEGRSVEEVEALLEMARTYRIAEAAEASTSTVADRGGPGVQS